MPAVTWNACNLSFNALHICLYPVSYRSSWNSLVSTSGARRTQKTVSSTSGHWTPSYCKCRSIFLKCWPTFGLKYWDQQLEIEYSREQYQNYKYRQFPGQENKTKTKSNKTRKWLIAGHRALSKFCNILWYHSRFKINVTMGIRNIS
jgi:hypothetical protein